MGVFLGFILVVCIIVLFIMQLNLHDRLKELENRLARRNTTSTPSVPEVPPMPVDPEPLVPLPPTQVYAHHQAPVAPAPEPIETEPSAITEWFKEYTLIKIGAALFFLGAVWFVSYAIDQNWISPTMRIFFGLLLGLGAYAAAIWRKQYRQGEYLTLTTLGTGIIIASVFAGQFLFDVLFHPMVALLLILLAVIYTVYVAVTERQQWLAITSVIASFVAPFLVNAPDTEPALFFTYLFVVTVGFLVLVTKTHWRAITAVLFGGVVWFEVIYYAGDKTADLTQWLIVTLFATTFLAATTISIWRSNKLQTLDISIALSNLTVFLLWLLALDIMSTFTAALATLLLGSLTYTMQATGRSRILTLAYAGITFALLVATSAFAFDSFTLTIALTLEVAAAIFALGHINANKNIQLAGNWLLLLPIVSSLQHFDAAAWSDSILHPDAIALYVLLVALIAIHFRHRLEAIQKQATWYLSAAGWIGLIGSVYSVAVALLFIEGLPLTDATADVSKYVVLFGLSSLYIVYTVRTLTPRSWQMVAYCSLLPAYVLTLPSFFVSAWERSVMHPHAIGLYLVTLCTAALALWTIRTNNNKEQSFICLSGGFLLAILWLELALLSQLVFESTITNPDVVQVFSYLTWALMSFAFATGLVLGKQPRMWIHIALASFLAALTFSLPSLTHSDWQSGVFHPHAFGLYTLLLILCSTGFTLRTLLTPAERTGWPLLTYVDTVAYSLAGLYATALVWLITHALVASDDFAVTAALLIYTVSGLGLYVLGKERGNGAVRWGGLLLLILVLLRLLLVEVWEMDTFWKIITFLGTGLLFILAAFIEKPFRGLSEARESEPLIPPKPPEAE